MVGNDALKNKTELFLHRLRYLQQLLIQFCCQPSLVI